MNLVEHFVQVNQTERQQSMLAEISEVRGYKDNDRFNLALAIQVYSQSIIQDLIGHLDLYQSCFHSVSGSSLVYGKLFIPGFAPSGELLTYICYDVINQIDAKINKIGAPAYFMPESTIFLKKGSFLYAPLQAWEAILASDDLFLVDGVWDCVSLNLAGIPTAAILSSELSPTVMQILKQYKRLYLVMDNDGAGSALYARMLSDFISVFRVVVPITVGKDVDNYIVSRGLASVHNQIKIGQNTYLR